MKCVSRDAKSLTFKLDPQERKLLALLLRRYPVLDPAHHQVASPTDRDALAEAQQTLTEARTAEQTENRHLVEHFIRTRLTLAPPAPAPPANPASDPESAPPPGPTSPSGPVSSPSSPSSPSSAAGAAGAAGGTESPPSAFPLRITRAEVDWLLRVVNDVRVGSWVRLGCPDEDALRKPMLAGRSLQDYALMELGGLYQSLLLDALEIEP